VRDIETLARQMREEAIRKTESSFERVERAKREQARRDAEERLKKLYFNAGRWAGGARDQTARKAFELINTADELLR
jgi:hypothetical protein